MENSYKLKAYFEEDTLQNKQSNILHLSSNVVIAGGPKCKDLVDGISSHLGISKVEFEVGNFKDGETFVKLGSDVNQKDVIVVQSMCKPVNESLMELIFLITTMKRNGANSVSAIIPYYAYARQERKVGEYKCITPSDVARLIESVGVNRVYTLDTHVDTIVAMFGPQIAADNLTSMELGAFYFATYLKLDNPIVVSPDAGAEKKCMNFVKYLRQFEGWSELSEPTVMIKHREKAGEVADIKIIGNVKGKDCIVVDDMCDSGGTLMSACQELVKNGAKSVYCFIPHGLFSGAFYENLEKSVVKLLVTTDSLPCYRQELE